MKKAIIVKYSFMTRVVIDSDKCQDIDEVVRLSKDKIRAKIDNNEWAENLTEWYEDEECPYGTNIKDGTSLTQTRSEQLLSCNKCGYYIHPENKTCLREGCKNY